MKLFLCSDLHLGRTPARTDPTWRDKVRTVSVWRNLVKEACRHRVAAVLLGGDVVDECNKYWEASGPLEEGARALAGAGIRLIAVAGNHDADVLPRIAADLPPGAFTLLGAGGFWERTTLLENGQPVLHLDGCSFPRTHVDTDPLDSYAPSPAGGVPVLGMVHGDLGASASRYAPLSLARLQRQPVAGWLLGHLHAPALFPGAPWVLMPGSPQPLDPSETGAHHVWEVELAGGHLSEPRPSLPSGLRYETLDIALEAQTPPMEDVLRSKIRAGLEGIENEHVVLRLRFTGETPDPEELDNRLRHLSDWEPRTGTRIDQVGNFCRAPIDLQACRALGGMPAQLASLLLDGVPDSLGTRLHELTREVARRPEFDGKDLAFPETPDIRPLAERLLGELLKQVSSP